ncbi:MULTISPECIES: TonB-dependent receptor [unclassified Methylophaga]|jgi:vitamin B12 transporter|uniref:TonB-dependent receptor domain-containing protein n=2 Tax=Methylophaga TaxID=40222 RepID=UPI00259D2E69|nr:MULTISPECIES: TonB-dependent receptor [unclassified Methylophaga]|tara:strand:+ start:4199 stop:6019 length:1821 start_codon:yes stop_codon:yes gene_type:complete
MTLFSKALPLRACTRLSAFTLISSLLSLPAIASDELNSITVTANRMPTENALAPTTVITREQIEKLQINDLPTLLSRTPGVDMARNGGLGNSTSLFIRGSNSDHVLVLVDGVKWFSATSGGSALQHFPVQLIDRIEIVRGPRSGVYGSEAIGGVIQIFTRKGQEGEIKPFFSIATGTKNTQTASAGVSGGTKNTKYNLSYSHLSSNGIDVRETTDPDHDGYRNNSLSFNVQHKITNDWQVGTTLLRTQGRAYYDGSGNPSSKVVEQVVGVNTSININDLWLTSFTLSESRDKSQAYADNIAGNDFNTRHRTISWLNTLTLNEKNKLNVGIDLDNDRVDGAYDYRETSRDNHAVFASWQGQANIHDWMISARYDDNEAFGDETTGTAEWGMSVTDDIRFVASAGTAFKAPTFNQLYAPDFGWFVGNPDLDAEKSKNYGIALQSTPSWGTWSVNLYKNKVRDLLSFQGNTYVNVDEAEIKGIEFDASTQLSGWDVNFNAAILDPEDTDTGNTLARRARQLANINLDHAINHQWSVGGSLKLRGKSYDNASNTNRLGGYGLVDLRVAYQFKPEWTVRLTGENMLNKDYQTADTYNSLGRTVMLSLSYQP